MFDEGYRDSLDHRMDLARRCLRTGNPAALLEQAAKSDNFNIGLLYSYIRSFVRLAYVGDVQKVAAELGITRQSVKRHITELENLIDGQLFGSIGTTSRLTADGTLWLPRAQEILELSRAFLIRPRTGDAHYQSTQLPLRMLLKDDCNSQLLKEFARSWMKSDQALDGKWFTPFEDFCIQYERCSGEWFAKKIGGRSAFADWYGADVIHESEGQTLGDMRTGEDLQEEISFLLDAVYTRGGLHFSEVSCSLPGANGGERKRLLYQRVLAETVDASGNPVVASLIRIIGLHQIDPMLG